MLMYIQDAGEVACVGSEISGWTSDQKHVGSLANPVIGLVDQEKGDSDSDPLGRMR
jgi:hypothetical protein